MTDDATSPGFWLPLFRMVLRQAILDPARLVLVQGNRIRVTSVSASVLIEGALDRIEVHRTWMGNLRLRHLDTGVQVRLTYGSIRKVRERLRAQVPPGWDERRFDAAAALHDPIYGVTPGIVKAQASITARLATALVDRGAHRV